MENESITITATHRITGKEVEWDLNDLCDLIKLVFPDREEQKKLLQEMFRD